MFEAVVVLCLLSDPQTCRSVLIPGYEGATKAICAERLVQDLPDPALLFAERATGPASCQRQAKAAELTQAAPGVFLHRGTISDATAANEGDVANVGFVVGDSAVAVIDSGGSRKVGEEIYRAIRNETDLPIAYVILTHMHPDHVLGASVFAQSGAQVVGHADLPRALQDRAEAYLTNFGRLIGEEAFLGTRVTLPDITVDTTMDINLGNRVLQLRAWPDAHTGNDLSVGDPASGILFTGDLMFHTHAPALDGNALGWQDVLAEMEVMPFDRIMPGHGGPILPWPEGAAPLSRYLDVLVADTRAAITRGDTLGEATEEVAQSESDRWELFDLFNPRNVTVAYTELEWE